MHRQTLCHAHLGVLQLRLTVPGMCCGESSEEKNRASLQTSCQSLLHTQVLERHSGVGGLSYNTLEFALHSRCTRFVSVQGGNSIVASYFGGTNIVFAVKGYELGASDDYHRQYSHFAQTKLLVASNYSSLVEYVRRQYIDA